MSPEVVHVTRRDFLKKSALTTGAVVVGGLLEACGRRVRLGPPTSVPPSPASTATQTLAPPTATPLPPPTATPLPSELATDLVLVGGKVITVDPADTVAQAVAVKDGLIQAVGDDEAIGALVGEKTKVIDLGGKAVTPGLIDPHNHLQVWGQLQGFYVALMPPEVKTMDDLRKKLAEAIAQTPEGEWVRGYFLSVGGRLPR
jgi:hypothetical protein